MRKSFEVLNIKCSGCANTVRKELEKEGFKTIEVDLTCEPRKVVVDITDEAYETLFRATLKKLGYPLADENIGMINGAGLKAKSFVSCAVGKMSEKNNTK
jgi:copper chaperone CopZ